MTPVVVDPKQAANALRWAVREMEERYKRLAAYGVRNIDQFNRNVKPAPGEQGRRGRRRPADQAAAVHRGRDRRAGGPDDGGGNEVEKSIARLAQMARAVGIHLILATQRPSVDVITGLIKANLPARISFRVSSKTDSRTILDSNGAEQLLGRGDMLYLPPASSRIDTAARAVHLGAGNGAPGELSAEAGQAGVRRDDHRRGQEAGGGHRVRQGRPVRRGGAHRRVERPGVDFISAAAAADRVQPCRKARGHDGGRRARLARRRRQAARGAGEEDYFDEVDAQLR